MAGPTSGSIEYWKRNKRLIAILLTVWALVSYVFGIIMAVPLSGIHIGQLPAGFWWAQQGSMYVFVALIFIYAWRMDKLDREFDVHEEKN
jgi:putative solute:sodium symporter small subunit